MAETTSGLDRVRAQVRAVAGEVGVRPQAGSRLLQFLRSFNIWFWAIVGVPTLIAAVYYFGIASDLYLSEAEFIIRSPKQVQMSPVGALLQSAGLTRAGEDTAAIQDFIMSRDAVRKLEKHNDLRQVFDRPEGDFVTRFPGLLGRSDFEALYWHYGFFVTVQTDSETGVTTLMVKAYRPQDAQNIARALLTYSEQLVNRLNARARRDAVQTAQEEVDRIQKHLTKIQDQLTAYRVRQKMIDPKTASMGVLQLIQQMTAAQTNARAQLAELLKNSPNSPQIPLVKTRIASLDKLIAEERAKLSGETDSVVATMTRYERLHLARQLAQRSLASALSSLEAARLEAQRQQIYLETIAQPNLADYPLYPRRFVSFLVIFVSCCLVYGLAWLLVASVREHQSA